MSGRALVVVLAMVAVSCTTLTKYHESRTPEWVAERTTVERDTFKKLNIVRSPKAKGTMGSGYNGEYYNAFLRGWNSTRADGTDSFQIYVATDHIGRWHHYHSAWDEDGNKLPLTKISSDVDCRRSGCSYFEDVGVNVDREYLESHRNSGIRLKVDGNGGEVIVRIPAGYVAGFLSKFEEASRSGHHAMK